MKVINNVVLTLLLSITVLIAQEQNIALSGANAGEYWLFIDKNLDSLNYKDHIHDKLKLSLNYSDLTLSSVFFLWNPSHPNPKKLNYIDYLVEYNNEPVNIEYGTYYTTFGRGLVLNQFLDEDFRIDNSIMGFKGGFNFFNSEFTILAGKPRNIFFQENTYIIINDTTDQIRGINFKTNLISLVSLGARYVRINRLTDFIPRAFNELFGGNVGIQIGHYEGYVEYARRLGCYPGVGGRLTGSGLLFSSNLSFPGLGVAFQIMDYDLLGFGDANYQYGTTYRYNEPPTPIKSGISVNRGTDEIGYGLSINYLLSDNLNIEFSNNKITSHDNSLNKFKQIFSIDSSMSGVLEQVIKVKSNLHENLEIIGAVERQVKQRIELPIDKKTETKPYIEGTYNFGNFFVEGGYEHNFITTDTSKYYDHALSVSVGKSELLQFTLRYERRNRIPGWLINKLGNEKSWPLAELSLDITNRHNLRIRVGGEKGGLVCSGGVCRFEEPFKGVKVVLTSIF